MNTMRFAHLTRPLSLLLSRRAIAAAIGLGALSSPGPIAAKKHRQKHKKVRRNDFGCVDVGHFCKNDGQCCSGIS